MLYNSHGLRRKPMPKKLNTSMPKPKNRTKRKPIMSVPKPRKKK